MAAACIPFSSPGLGNYSSEHFQNLPTLESAKSDFLVKAQGEEVVKNIIKKFFVEREMDRTFGVAMMHRHFHLENDEKLVEYRGTSTPWLSSIPGMKEPQPCIWAFDRDGTLRPTEFRYSQIEDAPFSEEAIRFIADFKELLDKLKLTGSLGLARYPGDDFKGSCEITHGRSNINLTPEDVGCLATLFITPAKVIISIHPTCVIFRPSGSFPNHFGNVGVVVPAMPTDRITLMEPISIL